jgi:uncharacterized lipoprotein
MSQFSERQKELIESYFALRQKSSLKYQAARFEGKKWHSVGKTMVRRSDDDWKLVVGKVGNDVEVCIVDPKGTEKTFAQPVKI